MRTAMKRNASRWGRKSAHSGADCARRPKGWNLAFAALVGLILGLWLEQVGADSAGGGSRIQWPQFWKRSNEPAAP